jgi:hypothetical protein
MDGIGLLLLVLTLLAIFTVFGLNIYSFYWAPGLKKEEGFEDQAPDDEKATDGKEEKGQDKSAAISEQIREVLEPMVVPELCPLYTQIRETAKKNELAGPNPPTQQEAEKRVEADLAIKIPGGALPCPLVTWPKDSASDLEWLDWLQKIPKDFGARVVLMAIYAKEFLGKQEDNLKSALSGQATGQKEGYADICTPDVIATRRAEAAKRRSESAAASCILPEDMNPKQIQESVTKLLKELVATKTKVLRDKGIDPTIDILPLIEQATKSGEYLKKQGAAAEKGTLSMTAPAPGL